MVVRRALGESIAEAYIELLAARGVDYFFGNGGTDFGPIVDAYAKRLAQELPARSRDRTARDYGDGDGHGYTMVTRKPQVVMVHTIPGTANATGGLINARASTCRCCSAPAARPSPRAA